MNGETKNPSYPNAADLMLFEATPGKRVVFLPDTPRFTIISASKDMCEFLHLPKEQFIGKSVFEAFPANPSDPESNGHENLRASLEYVVQYKRGHQMDKQRYDVSIEDGNFKEIYWQNNSVPVLNDKGEVVCIIHTAEDITDMIRAGEMKEQMVKQTLVQKKAEEANKEVERQKRLYEIITQSTPDLIYVFDLSYRFIYANKSLLTMWGKTWETAIGNTLLENGYEPWHAEMHEREIDRVVATRKPIRGEVSFPHATLGKRVYDYIFVPVFNEKGKVEAIVGTTRDITDIKRAEQTIRESEAKFRSLIEEAPVATCLFAGRNMIVEVANETMLGYWSKDSSVIGRPFEEAVPELNGQPFLQILNEVFTTGNTYEAKAAKADLEVAGVQSSYYFDFTYKPLFNAAGEVYAIMNMAIDVTQQVLATKAVEESERNLRNTILRAPVAICIFRGKEFRIEIANEKMFELWGKSAGEVINKPLFDAIPEAKNQGHEELMTQVLKTGEFFSASELPITLPRNGSIQTVYINFAYQPLREGNGTISGIMAVAIEVTEQVLARQKIEEVVRQRTQELAQANEALHNSNIELQRSNQNLEEFAHAASHDLKEPIRKILFFTQRLKETLSPQLKEDEIKAFGRIENATERMGNLIDDLLLYSHVSQRPHEMETIDLNQKVKRVLEDLELDVEEKRAVIHVEKLPVVQGYRRQLQQLFQNLITNALKYSKVDVSPKINITASISKHNERAYHVITVEDNGIGFEQQYEDKIFQMFSRLHGKNEYSGTGVGLSIVKKVVENHNGFIKVESKPGHGSSFEVYLPAN